MSDMKHQFRLFGRSLGDHPGLLWGFILPVLFTWAAFDGASDSDGEICPFVIIFVVVISLLIWFSILSTAWKGRHQYEDQDEEVDT